MMDVEITQDDREAAADLAARAERLAFGGNDAAAIRQGIWDYGGHIAAFVQLIARVRSTARAAGFTEGVERAAEVAEARAEQYYEPVQSDYDRRDGCYDAAAAIRKLSPTSPAS